jgi:hypothetical protein
MAFSKGERLRCDDFDPKMGWRLASLKCRIAIVLMICRYRRPKCSRLSAESGGKHAGSSTEPRPLPMSGRSYRGHAPLTLPPAGSKSEIGSQG